ncbi:autotransporter outer membrane beta-barrel domain-containing protein [Leminorella grimontii]|uniref:autotransporter outer membrane beta-barrel domain-containing protein n=1 Tax=Leminorella grimontii TaxID=82981 RepID=UPI00210033F7|nr:autotransporter outer membrane beta-barrel domain-containing protein [Leminorella grimontii]
MLGGEVELNGTTEIHMLNGGDGTAGILAHVAGSKVSAQKAVTITNVTDDSTAALYGIFASAGEIDFADAANVTISGGSEYSAAIAASSAGSIAVTGANIDVDAGRAFYASGVDSTITGRAAQYTIDGNMLAANGGAINVSMADGSRFNGITSLGATPGTIDLAMDGSQSVWNMSGDSVLSTLSLNNGATLAYAPVAAGGAFTPKTLTVEGNYAGNGGVLMLNTVLGGDGSLTDRLIVNGDVEAGTTKVAVVNVGGTGEQTVDGIKIVEVQGTSIGTFEQQNRIVAGAYDYSVVKGASDENWYLTSKVTPVDPEGPEGPARPGGESALRPEFGSYLANNYAANTMFLTRLHDRLGETQYTDVLTGEQKVTSMWMRNVGGHMRFRDSSEQLRTKSNRYVLQLGGDLAQWSSDGLDRWHLGAMVGYGNDRSKTVSSVNSRDSKGQTTGYSAGLYGTWYANQADKSGAYLDSWVMYSRFDNKVMGEERETEKYKSRGVTASVEGGYSFKVGENEHKSYWIQPKAQVVWMGVNAKDHYEAAGVDGSRVKVSDDTDGNLMTRLGVRAYMKGHSAIDEGKDREFQPFIEANWIHNTQNYGVKMAGVKNEMSGTKNIGEVKIGVEGQLSKRLNLWGNAAQQVGDKGYSDTSAMVGVKYSF